MEEFVEEGEKEERRNGGLARVYSRQTEKEVAYPAYLAIVVLRDKRDSCEIVGAGAGSGAG